MGFSFAQNYLDELDNLEIWTVKLPQRFISNRTTKHGRERKEILYEIKNISLPQMIHNTILYQFRSTSTVLDVDLWKKERVIKSYPDIIIIL